jgi:6-phosphogluconolactonase
VNPSFLTVSKDNTFVYSVNEFGAASTVLFCFNSITGKLDEINKQNSKGADPGYIINDDKMSLLQITLGSVFEKKNKDGSLAEAKQVVQHYGKEVIPKDKKVRMFTWFIFS